MAPIYATLLATVVVGNVVPITRYPPEVVVHASVCVPPLSLILIVSFWPLTGVPVGAAKVPPTAAAVTVYISVISVLTV